MVSINSLINNKKFLTVFLFFNIFLICCLGIYVYNNFFRSSVVTVSDSEDEESFEKFDNISELSETYMLLVENTEFELEDGIIFNFGKNGEYSGFFDSENRDVEGYSYQIVKRNDKDYLDIFNEDKSKSVSYEFSLLDDGSGISLYYEDSDSTIVLKY